MERIREGGRERCTGKMAFKDNSEVHKTSRSTGGMAEGMVMWADDTG